MKQDPYYRQMRYRNQVEEEDEAPSFIGCKIRLLLSVFLFVAFFICLQTNYPFFSFDTDTVYEKLQENYTLWNEENDESVSTER
ncbi:MAG: hypothetical protein IJ567_00440 [Lachnospiraceae bacterium]|nr:hypothetical protein [Lachnospiraceae bacterium]